MVVSDNGEQGIWYSFFVRFKEETVVRSQFLSDYLDYRIEDPRESEIVK